MAKSGYIIFREGQMLQRRSTGEKAQLHSIKEMEKLTKDQKGIKTLCYALRSLSESGRIILMDSDRLTKEWFVIVDKNAIAEMTVPELKSCLESAIEQEDYETCGIVRDRIKELV